MTNLRPKTLNQDLNSTQNLNKTPNLDPKIKARSMSKSEPMNHYLNDDLTLNLDE